MKTPSRNRKGSGSQAADNFIADHVFQSVGKRRENRLSIVNLFKFRVKRNFLALASFLRLS